MEIIEAKEAEINSCSLPLNILREESEEYWNFMETEFQTLYSHKFYLQSHSEEEIQNAIEKLFGHIIQCLSREEQVFISFPKSEEMCVFDFNFGVYVLLKPMTTDIPLTKINLYNNSVHLGGILEICNFIYSLITNKIQATKREIFYSDVAYFQKQEKVDSLIYEVSLLLGSFRENLNVIAATKGLVFGDLEYYEGQSLVDCRCDSSSTGRPIPSIIDNLSEIKSEAEFILIVEKETVFHKLLSEEIWNKIGKMIVITGKGSPDYSTRIFSRMLSRRLKLPVFYLGDCDPYGIEILCTYTFGCPSSASHSHLLAIPIIRWIGPFITDVVADRLLIVNNALLSLNDKDIQKLNNLVAKPYFQFANWNGEIYFGELQRDRFQLWWENIRVMLEIKRKFEIEAVSEIVKGGLSMYIKEVILNSHWL